MKSLLGLTIGTLAAALAVPVARADEPVKLEGILQLVVEPEPEANAKQLQDVLIEVADGPEQPVREPLGEVSVKPSEFWLGLNCKLVDDSLRAQLKLPAGQGLVISEVVADSPAAKAGVKPHDVLLSAGDKPVADLASLVKILDENKEQALALKLVRAGEHLKVEAIPAKRPADSVLELATWLNDGIKFAPGDDKVRMRFLHPGMILPHGVRVMANREFPENLTVQITKKGKEPASVRVSQGDKNWDVSENDLKELPQDVRGHVEGLLGRRQAIDGFSLKLDATAPLSPPVVKSPRLDFEAIGVKPDESRLEKRLDEMSRRLQDLRKEIKELRDSRNRDAETPKDGKSEL